VSPADRLRVGLVTREFPPEVYGGAGVHVEYLTAALAELGDVGVHCFGAPRSSPLVHGTYEPWDALAGGGPHVAALRHLSTDLAIVPQLEGVDVVHTHTWYTNLAGHLAKLCFDVPHVATSHSLEPLRPWKAEQLGGGYALSRFAEQTALEAADAVIAVSAQMGHDVLASYPAIDPARVHVIHNGIDPEEYRADAGTDVLDRHDIAGDVPTVTFVGRITRQKGLTHLLDAARHFEPGTQLVLCAGAPDTPELAREVGAAVAALRDSGQLRVVWIEAMLPRTEIVQILSHSTVFCCPSIYEPFGLVNVEAMACGAAVVATAVGGIPEVVVEGETGYLVGFEPGADPFGTPADPAAFARDLAERINALVRDPGRAAAFGAAGRRRVVEHFSWSTIAARTVTLYRSLLA
jgi:alpha-maltose-1-phosphate synthase